jgi:hypothetical protein
LILQTSFARHQIPRHLMYPAAYHWAVALKNLLGLGFMTHCLRSSG